MIFKETKARNKMTLEDIKKSACANLNPHLFESATQQKKVKLPGNPSKIINWMHWQISMWCLEKNLFIHKELQFHSHRKYRFDFAVTDNEDPALSKIKIAIEYQGGIFMKKSGHTNPAGATRDCDKSNLAQSEGWRVLTFTVLNYQTVLQELEKMML